MMLYPCMSDLLRKVDNRYLLVNITAKRARDIAQDAEDRELALKDKPVSIALDDIIRDRIMVVEEGQAVYETGYPAP